jgi:hypothetical protein
MDMQRVESAGTGSSRQPRPVARPSRDLEGHLADTGAPRGRSSLSLQALSARAWLGARLARPVASRYPGLTVRKQSEQ